MQPQNQCAIHRQQQCTCIHRNSTRESISPSSGTGMSPSYPNSEPALDTIDRYNSGLGSQYTKSVMSSGRQSSISPPSASLSQTLQIDNGEYFELFYLKE